MKTKEGKFIVRVTANDGFIIGEEFWGTENDAWKRAEELANALDTNIYDIEDRRRRWTSTDVRMFCIREDLFTRGDNQNYSSLLRFVDTHEPTEDNVLLVAAMILVNSKVVDLETIVAECKEFAKVVEKECVWNS